MRAIGLFLLKVAAAGAFFYFVGGLSLRASVAIVMVLAFVGDWSRPQESVSRFMPYEVDITPQIELMLIDLGLVTDEEWVKLVGDRPPRFPWTPLHTIYYGINAVVFSGDTPGDMLVHWTGPNYYTKGIGYLSSLNFLSFPIPSLQGLTDDCYWSPDFFFNGGEMGIRVHDSWWSEHKERIEKEGLAKNIFHEDNFGTTRVTLAVFPSKAFWPFEFGTWTEKAKEELREEIKKELPLVGWRVERVGNEEIGYFGDQYVSKYAEVWLRQLAKGY